MIDADTPLLEAGLTSVGAIELRNQLQHAYGYSPKLPITLIFDFPTARCIAPSLGTHATPSVGDAASIVASRDVKHGAALLGASVRLPSGSSTLQAVWRTATSASDLVTEVPTNRWDLNEVLALGPLATACIRHGGFLMGVCQFDHAFFRIAEAEAASIDPQQRMLLEGSYRALHSMGSEEAGSHETLGLSLIHI